MDLWSIERIPSSNLLFSFSLPRRGGSPLVFFMVTAGSRMRMKSVPLCPCINFLFLVALTRRRRKKRMGGFWWLSEK